MDLHDRDHIMEPRLQALRVIAVLLAGGIVTYMFLAWFLLRSVIIEPIAKLSQAVNLGLGLAGLLVILAGYVVGRRMRDSTTFSGSAQMAEQTDGKRLTGLLARYTRSFIVAAAAREAAAVIGLVLALLNGDIRPALLLGGVALGSMLIHWPRRGAVENWLSQQSRLG